MRRRGWCELAGRRSRVQGFFRSRWVEAPGHVRELDSVALPRGFRAAGVAAGLKPEGLDVGVLVSDEPETVSAARFTSNARVGAPVIASRESGHHRLRAVVANAACSNVGDGQRGLDTARATQVLAAELLGIEPAQVGVASTGVIGTELPREPLLSRRAGRGGPARRRRRRLLPGDPHKRSRAQARLPRGGAGRRQRAPVRAGEGGGDDLAALRHHVLLRADRCRDVRRDDRPAHGRDGQALVRPRERGRPALHQRHGVRTGKRRLRRQRRAADRRRAALRRGT